VSRLITKIYLLFYRWRGIVIKQNVLIKPFVLLTRGIANSKKGSITIQSNCQLLQGAIINAYGGTVNLAPNVFIGEHVVIYGHGGVDIGEHTLIAMHTCIVSSNHTIPDKNTLIRSQPDVLLPVKIGRDVWLGAGVKVMGGVTIGDGCVVAAGAVVTKDLPPYSISKGVPAVVTGYRND
jgi:acetyltransferase-like isoleucine patch superfamily enzyme